MEPEEDVLLSLTGFDTREELESKLAQALTLPADQVSIVEEEEDRVLFVVFGHNRSTHELIETIHKNNTTWNCSLADMEEEILVEEDEAYQLWQSMSPESRTSHLKAVLSPDGEPVQPQHGIHPVSPEQALQDQSQRDPQLLELDNVPRIELAELEQANWEEPFVITGFGANDTSVMTKRNLLEQLGNVLVRTGNRNTLVESGFDNSLPQTLAEAFDSASIVFTPLNELPLSFQSDLQPLLSEFPPFPHHNNHNNNAPPHKYTVCVAPQAGFGIGMHKHNAAFFWLLQGRKKWYMSRFVTEPTHPGFYTTQSTHKCLLNPGEILFVPDQWYHEIFNLEYTAGIQALPG